MKRIIIKTDERKLVGYSRGKELYKKIEDTMVYDGDLTIILFPTNVDDVSISFVNGFTEGIFKHINRDEFENYFKVVGSDNVVEKFIRSINL